MLKIVLIAAVMVLLVVGVIPALVDPAGVGQLSVSELLTALRGFGYDAYSDPAGDFHVNNLFPNTDDTYDIGRDDLRFQDIFLSGSIDREAGDGGGGYWHEYRLDAINLAAGGSGATLVVPSGDTLGGYRLNVNTEYLYFASHVEDDWDGASDGILDIEFEVGVNNTGGNDADVVVITASCYHKALGAVATTLNAHSGSTIVGKAGEWKLFTQDVTIDDLAVDETISFRLNLDTGNSDVDNVIINHIEFKYPTKTPGLERP